VTWHQFSGDDDGEGDVACVVGDCAVILAPRVLGSFTLECPTVPCDAPANRGGPVRVRPGQDGAVLHVLQQTGSKILRSPVRDPVGAPL
jgi:hypothetical protein